MKGKSILITGGTGSLGKSLTKHILTNHPEINRLIIFSRDEQKQFVMSQEYPESEWPQIRFFIGDVRDKERLRRAFEGVDYVIHAAAMKHVHLAEYNPDECIKTNIGGARNIVEVAIEKKVERVVALSTDKACAPINLYGATKLTSDKLFIAANKMIGDRKTKFSVVRYGNVMGSNGSVIPFFFKRKKIDNVIPITHVEMTRFNISLQQGVNMVMFALENALGGELYVPKIPSYRILDVAKAVAPETEIKVVGIRPGEKLHEEMITSSDSLNTYDVGKYYVILPNDKKFKENFESLYNCKKVPEGFSYNSRDNNEWETVDSLVRKIKNLGLNE